MTQKPPPLPIPIELQKQIQEAEMEREKEKKSRHVQELLRDGKTKEVLKHFDELFNYTPPNE